MEYGEGADVEGGGGRRGDGAGLGGESVPTEDDSFMKPTESTREFNWKLCLVIFTLKRGNLFLLFRYPKTRGLISSNRDNFNPTRCATNTEKSTKSQRVDFKDILQAFIVCR